MKGKGDFIRGVIKYKKMVYFITVLLVCLGGYGLFKINKNEYPTFEIKEGLVVGLYPGATAEEVEEQLTTPIENLLFNFSEVSRATYSYSKDGMCFIYVVVDAPVSKKDEVWSKIKLKLNSYRKLLPPGVLALEVLDDFSNISSVLIAMESSDKGYAEMKEYADDLESRLKELPEVASFKVYGNQTEEIAVEVDMELLSAYGIRPTSLFLDYQSSTTQVVSGRFVTDYANSPIHVGNMVASEQEIAEKIVWAGPQGDIIRLKDIATIKRGYKKPSSYVDYNGNSALILSVDMRPENNIVAFGKDVDKILEEFSRTLPDSVKLTKITDQPKVVSTSVWLFLRDLLISMLVVIVVMLLLFPMRSALIASSGVPICTAVTIAVMYVCGMELNTVTLAALIVVLGMIVDDSIITMDGYIDKLGRGMRRVDAACASARELIVPMFIATAAIALMFYPMRAIITNYLGDFVQMFPIVITIALAASLIYAVTVVPSLEVKFIGGAGSGRKSRLERRQEVFFRALQKSYEKLQAVCFRHPYKTVCVGMLTVALGVFMFLQLNIQMMPMAERDCFAVEIYLDPNSSLEETKTVTDSLQLVLLSDRRVTSVTSFVGTGAPRFHATYAPKIPSESFAQLIVNTKTNLDAEAVLKEYGQKFEFWFPEAHVRFKQMDYQAVTAPVGVTFKGGTIDQMKPYADTLKAYMMGLGNLLQWVHSDCDNFISTVSVDVDPNEAARLGVNRAFLSLSLAGAYGGQTVATLWENGESIPVNLYSVSHANDATYESIGNQMVTTTIPGVYVPLRQVADVKPAWEPESIPHINGKDALTVYADMKFGRSQPEAMRVLKKYVSANIEPYLPEGVTVSYEGLSTVNRKVVPEILLTLICAVAILFFFLLFHFKKMSLAALTLVLSLLCLFGAAFGLWIFGLDFGMTAVLGVVSLIGIVVRNGILMFDHAEDLRRGTGLTVKEAAMEAGKRRMRPIFLTSCTTALGVLPMVLSGDALWMPMGVVICFGTMLSIILIVEIMPVCYWQVFKTKEVEDEK
ncbi:MAG: efflux RND transporter permease subunit [Bacteroidales bacterium]|nr:efflux RND transporter permease subunit [Bacteroidales bacterium]